VFDIVAMRGAHFLRELMTASSLDGGKFVRAMCERLTVGLDVPALTKRRLFLDSPVRQKLSVSGRIWWDTRIRHEAMYPDMVKYTVPKMKYLRGIRDYVNVAKNAALNWKSSLHIVIDDN
jgi:hypothetical protein